MSSVYPLQQTFQEGIISRRVTGRSQVEAYGNALAECTNWQIKPQGSMRYRNGSQYLAQAQGIDSKLINFSLPDRDDFMIEIGQDEIRVYNADGTIAVKAGSGGNIVGNVLIDPKFQQNFAEWDWTSIQRPIGRGSSFDEYNNRQPTALPNVGVEFIYNEFFPPDEFRPEPRYPSEYSVSQDFDIPLASSQYNFKSVLKLTGDNSLAEGNQYRVSVTVSRKNGATVANQVYTYTSSSQWNTNLPIDFNFTSDGSVSRYTLKIKHEHIKGSGNQTPDYACRQSGLEIKEIAGGGGTPEEPAIFSSPYTGKNLQAIQSSTDTGTGQLVIVHPDIQPRLITVTAQGSIELQVITFNGKPDDWGANNWPAVVEFFQGRLFLARAKTKKSAIWASKVAQNFNDFFDFENAQSSSGDKPLVFELNTNGVIEWLRGQKQLIIGTDRSIWTGSGFGKTALTSASFDFSEQTRLGTTGIIDPQYIAEQVAFVGLDKRRVRTVNFDAELIDGYIASELTLKADQLFDTRIIDMAYARDPDYQLACVTDDGKLKICMHDRVTQLTAWYVYETNGLYKQIEFISDGTGSALWVVVERTNSDGTPSVQLEKFDAGAEVNAHLDSYVIADSERIENENGVGGFSNAYSSGFDGQGVNVIVFANVPNIFEQKKVQCSFFTPPATGSDLAPNTLYPHPDVYVFEGKAKLQNYVPEGSIILVGYGYTAKATTLPLEMGNRAGTGQGTKRHFNRIFARIINNSTYPILNGYRPIPEKADIFNIEATTEIEADVEVRNEGTLERGVISIEQDIPLNCEIACIFGKAISKVT